MYVYSARMAEADQNGEKHVILCRVVLGNVEKVERGSQQCYPSTVEFDTGSDDPKNPNWYIVWSSNMNRHILPECIVTYKPSSGYVQGKRGSLFLFIRAVLIILMHELINAISCIGQLRGSSCTKYPLEKLFTKMRSSLSPSKLQEVITLYHNYKVN